MDTVGFVYYFFVFLLFMLAGFVRFYFRRYLVLFLVLRFLDFVVEGVVLFVKSLYLGWVVLGWGFSFVVICLLIFRGVFSVCRESFGFVV